MRTGARSPRPAPPTSAGPGESLELPHCYAPPCCARIRFSIPLRSIRGGPSWRPSMRARPCVDSNPVPALRSRRLRRYSETPRCGDLHRRKRYSGRERSSWSGRGCTCTACGPACHREPVVFFRPGSHGGHVTGSARCEGVARSVPPATRVLAARIADHSGSGSARPRLPTVRGLSPESPGSHLR